MEFGPDPRQENSHDFKSFVSLRANYVTYLSCVISQEMHSETTGCK